MLAELPGLRVVALTAPGEPGVLLDDLGEQAARACLGRLDEADGDELAPRLRAQVVLGRLARRGEHGGCGALVIRVGQRRLDPLHEEARLRHLQDACDLSLVILQNEHAMPQLRTRPMVGSFSIWRSKYSSDSRSFSNSWRAGPGPMRSMSI